MAGGECGDTQCPVCCAPERSGVMLAAIVRRNLQHPDTPHCLCQSLHSLRTVHLDRENLSRLSDLEIVKDAHSLYLQENQIKKIENVAVLKKLRFLTLSGNKIEKLENLLGLKKLQFLDLSNNLIQRLDVGELPQTLRILHLTGNPCTKIKDYRCRVLEALPALEELDGEAVQELNSQYSVNEGESDSDDSDTSLPLEDSDSLSIVGQELLQRSYQRRDTALREHKDRLAELSDGESSVSRPPSRDIHYMRSQDCNSQMRTISEDGKNASQPENNINILKGDTSSLSSKKEKDVSPMKPSGGRVSSERKSHSGLRTTSSIASPAPDTRIKLQASKVPTAKMRSATSALKNERQTTSPTPVQKRVTTPSKKPLGATEKAPTPARSATSAPSQRQATPSSASKKLQTAPTKRNSTSLQLVSQK